MSSARRRLGVHRGDGGLELVGPEGRWDSARSTSATPSAISGPIPQRAVLLGERDEAAVGRRARGPARVGEQHQREQAGDLAVVGQQRVHHAGEPDRLGRELGALQVGAGDAV